MRCEDPLAVAVEQSLDRSEPMCRGFLKTFRKLVSAVPSKRGHFLESVFRANRISTLFPSRRNVAAGRSQLGDQLVRATSVAGREGTARIARISSSRDRRSSASRIAASGPRAAPAARAGSAGRWRPARRRGTSGRAAGRRTGPVRHGARRAGRGTSRTWRGCARPRPPRRLRRAPRAGRPHRPGRTPRCRGRAAAAAAGRRPRCRSGRRRTPRPRSAAPREPAGAATAPRGRRPRSPRGSRSRRTAAARGRPAAAGGAPARGSGPRRRAAAWHAREQHGVQREDRHPDRHVATVVRSLDWPHDPPDRPPRSRQRLPDYRTVVPRADIDVEAALHVVRPICDAVRDRGVEAIREYSERFDGVARDDIAVPAEALTAALWPSSTPTSGPGLEESIRRLRATCEAELERDVATEVGAGRPGHPAARCRSTGSGSTCPAGSRRWSPACVMNVVPAQVAGVGSIAAHQLAADGVRRAAAPDDPRRVRAARRRRGLRRRRRPGDRDVRLRRRAVPPGRPGHRARATSTTVAAKRLLKGVVGIDSEAGPTEIAILADDTADPAYVAADLISQAEHDPMAASVLVTDSRRLADEVEAELDKQVSATKHIERITHRALRQPVRRSCWSTTSTRASTSSTPTPPSTSRSRPPTPAAVAARVRNAGAIFVGSVRAGVARRLLRRVQPRAADRRLRLPLLGAVGARVPARRARRRLRPATRSPRWPTTW